MAYQTNKEIRVESADLTERLRQIRIDKGLPPDPEPRPKIVDIALSHAIIDRMEPFKAIVIKYASLLSQGKFVSIDTDKLAKYREYADFLRYSTGLISGVYGMGASAALSCMDRINQAITDGTADMLSATEQARHLHYDIGFMSRDEGMRHEAYEYRQATGESPEGKYDDEAAFQAALEAVRAQIPSKEEENLYE